MAFWLDLDAIRALKSSKEYITNITFGYLLRHVSCSGRNFWCASFLNSTSKNVLPSGLRNESSGMPLQPFFSFFQHTHPHARAYERHCFSSCNSSCFIVSVCVISSVLNVCITRSRASLNENGLKSSFFISLNICVKHLKHAFTCAILFPFCSEHLDGAFDFYKVIIIIAIRYQRE